jgi:hypothetical protein
MKRIIILSLTAAMLFICCSTNEFDIKESDVPPNVVAALKAKYPAATVKKWQAEKEGDNFYFEAEIEDGGKEKDIRITSDGTSVTEED